MAEDGMLQEAIEALRQGQRGRARDLLTRLLRVDAQNPEYWLWMSAAVDTPKEQVYCLQSILKIDPQHTKARQGLILLGVLPPEDYPIPERTLRRTWQAAFEEESPPLGRKKFSRIGGVLVVLLLIGLLATGIFGINFKRQPAVVAQATRTAGPLPTFTPTPTFLNAAPPVETPTPAATERPSLAAQLDATYTPTPLPLRTPHPEEAYQAAMRAFQAQDWAKALTFLDQLTQGQDPPADVLFYQGEAHRFARQYNEAMVAYESALEQNPKLAPAWLGLAQARLALDPKASVLSNLNQALQANPEYGPAYLERAAFLLAQGKTEAALQDLEQAQKWLPSSPLVFLRLAQAQLQTGETEQALLSAQKALELDVTYLPTYLVLGEAALLKDEISTATDALNTYTAYEPQDPLGWVLLGRALLTEGDTEAAFAAFQTAEDLDDLPPEVRYQLQLSRGLANLEAGQEETALEDLSEVYTAAPQSYEANLAYGRALFESGALGDAGVRFSVAWREAKTPAEQAAVLYWRAQLHEANGNAQAAARDWQELLALPSQAVPAEWAKVARLHQATPTPMPTAKATATTTATARRP